jgi:hypothetical protein
LQAPNRYQQPRRLPNITSAAIDGYSPDLPTIALLSGEFFVRYESIYRMCSNLLRAFIRLSNLD